MKEKTSNSEPIVYLLQEVPGTKIGRPKYNIIGAQKLVVQNIILLAHKSLVK